MSIHIEWKILIVWHANLLILLKCIIYLSTCHTNKKLYFKPQVKSYSSNHTTVLLFANVLWNVDAGNTKSLNCVGNDGTCNHCWLCIWETCLCNNAYSLLSKVKDWMEWCMLIQSVDGEALEYRGSRQRAMKIYQVTWGTLTAFEQDIQMAVGRRSRW